MILYLSEELRQMVNRIAETQLDMEALLRAFHIPYTSIGDGKLRVELPDGFVTFASAEKARYEEKVEDGVLWIRAWFITNRGYSAVGNSGDDLMREILHAAGLEEWRRVNAEKLVSLPLPPWARVGTGYADGDSEIWPWGPQVFSVWMTETEAKEAAAKFAAELNQLLEQA